MHLSVLAVMLGSTILVLGGCVPKYPTLNERTAWPAIGSVATGNMTAGYQELIQAHRNAVMVTGAAPLREEIGETCYEALTSFYRYPWIRDIMVLRNSPLLDAQSDRYWAMMIEEVIHIRTHECDTCASDVWWRGTPPLNIAHELKHSEQQRTMGVSFWPVYAETHLPEMPAENFLEEEARASQEAFDLQFPRAC